MKIHFILLSCMLFASIAQAKENIQINNAWVRATVPGQEVSGAFLSVKSLLPAKLIKVESSIADSVEIHSMTMKNGVMEMRELKTLALPAGKLVKLAPGELHLMLIDIKRQLKPGDKVPLKLTLQFETNTQAVKEITAVVK